MDIVYNLFKILDLGDITDIKRVDSSQNIVYKVTTKNSNYILKEYSSDAIKNSEDLDKRIKQITVSEKLNESGIPTILPLKFDNHYFIYYQNKYYLIYKYFDYLILKEDEITLEHIKVLASTLAKMHKANVQIELPTQYREISIDYDDYLEKFKNLNKDLYNILNKNITSLKKLTYDCNNNISKIKNKLCISHNDYKLKNILWDDMNMYLLDFDACALSNPIVSLVESAFALSKQGGSINLEYYEYYLKNYFKIYNDNITNYNDAILVAMNGKLQWLEYLFSKCSTDLGSINDSISMINELMLYIDNIDKFKQIYLQVKKIV